MSLPNIIVPAFPNVPAFPGVPPLLTNPAASISTVIGALTGDDQSLTSQAAPAQWGVFQGGSAVIVPDTIVAFEFKRDFRVVDYPVEGGAVASYNKVAEPFEPRFTMTKAGTAADITDFVQQVETAVASLNLYDVVTPEYTWFNANLIHWDTARTAKGGVSMLTINVWLREIRTAPSPSFSQTKTSAGQDPVNGGTVQAQTPTPTQSAAAAGGGT